MRFCDGRRWLSLGVSLGVLSACLGCKPQKPDSASKTTRRSQTYSAVPIVAGIVEQKDVPIYLDGLGNVQAFNTVTIRSRVDGQVQRIAFEEGQDVRAGDLLAQIDPAPFQAQVDQNVAKKAADEAQLSVARINFARC